MKQKKHVKFKMFLQKGMRKIIMEIEKNKAIIEAILYAAGREVKMSELMAALELGAEDITTIIESMKAEYKNLNRGIEIIEINGSYQLCTKKEYFDYIYPMFDNRAKPNLSTAALETLAIIAYNPKITRAEIEAIRGVNSDGTIYKLLDYGLIEDAGKADLPGGACQVQGSGPEEEDPTDSMGQAGQYRTSFSGNRRGKYVQCVPHQCHPQGRGPKGYSAGGFESGSSQI